MAEEKKYTHFSLQNFTECWSGSNVAETYNQYGKEVGFVTPGHPKPWIGCSDSNSQQCPKGSLHCVGMETTNYVYGLKDGKCEGFFLIGVLFLVFFLIGALFLAQKQY